MSDSFVWRGLAFERPEGSTGPFCHGHWSVWRPKTLWTASWISPVYDDTEVGEEDDPTIVLERLLERLRVKVRLERAQMASLQRMLEPHVATCDALEKDLVALGVPAER